MDATQTRRCYGQCKNILPLDLFSPGSKMCRECARVYNRARYAEKKDYLRAQMQAWRDANREKHNAYNRKYYRANPQKANATSKNWAANNPVRKFASSALSQARSRKVEVTLSIDDVVQMWAAQNGLCALSNTPMVPGSTKGWTPLSPSLDRITAGGAYSKENVRIVCYCLNAGRSNMSDEDFINMCRAVVRKADGA